MTILTWPDAPVSSIRRTLRTAVAGSASPFTLSEQMQDWGGEVWDYEIDVPPQRDRSGRALEAFFNQLGGRRGRFLFADPSIQNAPSGSPVVALARRNLLSYTEAFDNAVWGKVNINVSQDTLGVLPSNYNWQRLEVSETGGIIERRITQPHNVEAGQVYSWSFLVAPDQVRFIMVYAHAAFTTTNNAAGRRATINLDTGEIAYAQSASDLVVEIQTVSGGVYKVTAMATALFSATNAFVIRVNLKDDLSSGNGSTLTSGDGLFLTAFQFETGPLSDYQPILGATYTAPSVRANMLPTSGWTGPMDAGAFFSLGSGANTRLHQLTRDVTPSADGRADVHFHPRLRFPPVEGEPLEVERPRVLLRMAGPVPANISAAKNYTFSVQAREAIR